MHVSAELVTDLKSSDVEVSKKAMEKADSFIAALDEPCRTKVNRTVINSSPSPQESVVKARTRRLSRAAAQSHPVSMDCNLTYLWYIFPSVLQNLQDSSAGE